MSADPIHAGEAITFEAMRLEELIQALISRGYEPIGPTVRDGAIVYDRLSSMQDLPAGWTDEQSAGRYQLKRRRDDALFGYAAGPHTWKSFLFPPHQHLWRAERNGSALHILNNDRRPEPRYAFLGVRACDLSAIALHDKIFLEGQHVDPGYKSRRENLFILAVNCSQAAGNCFCVSTNTGPKAISGFDIAVTEIAQEGKRRLFAEAGTRLGAEMLLQVPHMPAGEADRQQAERVVVHTARHMGRKLDTRALRELLYRNYEHPQWDSVADRCLSCGNCTLVCPTCFCSTVEDTTDLSGNQAERMRRWDSCFTVDFSYIHGGSVRPTTRSRYRQWMVHKLATWIDQFGVLGCVGCGRCITWCPVGIDITAEAAAIRESDSVKAPAEQGRESE